MTTDPFEQILAGTAAHTGDEFFKSLVENLAKVLGTSGAWVTEFLEREKKRLVTLFNIFAARAASELRRIPQGGGRKGEGNQAIKTC
ncbi:MAG: hypothetical protein ACNA8K_15640 [Cyclonatronaceae bacterium]